MRTHARAVVIGGGVVGVSTLYHLAKKGWSDVVLVERNELTSGSTWHAAGLLPLFNLSYSVGQIHKYSVRFYQELAEDTGMDTGFRKVSNVRLARTRDRWDEYMYYAGIARTLGIDVKMLSPEEIKALWPYVEVDGLIGAIQHPEDGYIQPADLTQALARGARDRGAEINRNTRVTAIEQQPNGEWLVKTDKGDITTEHVISATGNFAAGLIASATGAEGVGEEAGKQVVLDVYSTVGWYAIAIGVGVMVISPLIKKLMHLDTLQDDDVGDDLLGQSEGPGEPQGAGIHPETRPLG